MYLKIQNHFISAGSRIISNCKIRIVNFKMLITTLPITTKTYLVKAIEITGVQYFPIFCHSCVQPTRVKIAKIFQSNIIPAAKGIDQ